MHDSHIKIDKSRFLAGNHCRSRLISTISEHGSRLNSKDIEADWFQRFTGKATDWF